MQHICGCEGRQACLCSAAMCSSWVWYSQCLCYGLPATSTQHASAVLQHTCLCLLMSQCALFARTCTCAYKSVEVSCATACGSVHSTPVLHHMLWLTALGVCCCVKPACICICCQRACCACVQHGSCFQTATDGTARALHVQQAQVGSENLHVHYAVAAVCDAATPTCKTGSVTVCCMLLFQRLILTANDKHSRLV